MQKFPFKMVFVNIFMLAAVTLSVEGFPKSGSFCYGPSSLACTTHTLSCGDGEVISVATAIFGTKAASFSCSPGNICNSNPSCCVFQNSNEMRVNIPGDYMDSIQQNCTNQQSCNINLPYTASPEYHFVYYNYECISKSAILSMMCKDSITTPRQSYMFYLGNQRSDNLRINCSCQITSESPEVTLYTRYVKLNPSTCPSFQTTLSTLRLPNCSATGLQEEFRFVGHLPTPVYMPVESLVTHPEDIFSLRFNSRTLGKPITVNCTGCGVDVAGVCGKTTQIAQSCYGAAACGKHPIACKQGSLIAFTPYAYIGHRYYESPTCQKATCNSDPSCCKYERADTVYLLSDEEKSDLYRECLYRESCFATPSYRNPGNATYAYYKYECIPEASIIDIVTPSSVAGFGEVYLHYNGSARTADTTMDCKCRVVAAAPTVTVTIYLMKLHPDTCCQLNISSADTSLPETCTEQKGVEVYSSSSIVSASPIEVHLNKIMTRPDDFMVVRFNSGQGIDVTCDGCTESPDTEKAVCTYPKPEAITAGEPESDTVAIAAGIVGGILLLALLILVAWKCKRNKDTKVAHPADF